MPEIVEKAKETMGNAWEATKDTAQNIKEKVTGSTETAGDKASDAWDATKDKARDLKNDCHEKKGEVKEKVSLASFPPPRIHRALADQSREHSFASHTHKTPRFSPKPPPKSPPSVCNLRGSRNRECDASAKV